jgi:hypothetical protein
MSSFGDTKEIPIMLAYVSEGAQPTADARVCGRAFPVLQAPYTYEEAAAHLFCSLWQITPHPSKVDQSCTHASRCFIDNISLPDEFTQDPAILYVDACMCSSVGCMK